MSSPLRLGLIGAGRWGRNYLKTIPSVAGVRLASVASRNPDTRRLIPKGCVVVSDWRQVACSRDLDGVVIATPPRLHAEMTRTAVDAGLAVLVEKPLTMDLAEARGLLQFASERGGRVLVDHTHLFHPGYRVLKERAAHLGPVKAIRSMGGNWGPFRAETPPLWDYGAHDVSMALDLMGAKPGAFKTERTDTKRQSGGAGENFSLELEFADGVQCVICIGNMMRPKKRRLEVLFKEKALVLDDVKGTLSLYGLIGSKLAPKGQPVAFLRKAPLTCAVEAFVAAIRGGSRDLSSLKLGVNVVETLEACEAALAGRS